MYFVTICTEGRGCWFGEIKEEKMVPNEAGQTVAQIWYSLSDRFHFVELDVFVIMPNHVHGIIAITEDGDHKRKGDRKDRPYEFIEDKGGTITKDDDNCRGESRIRPRGTADNSLGRIIQAFKSLTTREYAGGVSNHDWQPFEARLWQRNYHDHIVRNERELDNIRQYIVNNPLGWAEDRENPEARAIPNREPWET
jgi:REP element-mobilizing transposase RayT